MLFRVSTGRVNKKRYAFREETGSAKKIFTFFAPADII
jgi:hypothetical protein